MPDFIAVLIEDDAQQSEVSKRVLHEAGFEVRDFEAIAPALEYLARTDDLIDLFVLDRRLPVNPGEQDSEELGDELLRQVRADFPDARILVFTGFATIPHVQESVQGSGQLPAHDGRCIDRITVLEKHQSLEFRDHVQDFQRLLQSLEDVEVVIGEDQVADFQDLRDLRRVALEYRASSIHATPLSGGITDARVWRCELRHTKGPLATVVAKRVNKPVTRGGLAELLPRAMTTSVVGSISGLIRGRHINVLQNAGDSTISLLEMIASDPSHAATVVKPLWDALDQVGDIQQLLPVAEICESLVSWDRLAGLLAPYGVRPPLGSLRATVHIGARHGDLHPGNILIDKEAACLIDFDSSTFASRALDPVTILISTLTHPESPIRGEAWPGPDEIDRTFGSPEFGSSHSHAEWFSAVSDWLKARKSSEREFWALSLTYAGRQLQYGDVTGDSSVEERVVAIARLAATRLASS